MLFLWLFLCFTKCETKYLCFTTGPASNYRCTTENTVTEVTNETDFTSLITSRIKSTDKDIYIYLSGPIEFEFPFNIFNNKNLTVQFTDSGASGIFDITDIANIDINLLFLSQHSSNPIVTLEGTSFVQPQSTFKLQNIDLNASFTNFQVKSFTSIHSTFTTLQINTNSFVYYVNSDIELKLNDKKAVVGEKTIEFSNDNANLQITFEPSHEIIITNEATKSSSLPKISISNANSITFNGNTYSESNSFSLINCPLLIANVNYLPLSSLKFTDYVQIFKIIVSNSITITDISLERRQNLTIDVANKPPTSRISVNVKSVSLKEGFVQLLSSWIDFVVDEFEFESTILPVSPCLGSGGSSTFIAKAATIESENKLIEINTIFIQLDIKGPQTDQTLSKLISQTWESIKFESFSKSVKNEAISSFYFTPSDINGFGSTKESRIIEATANLNTDLTITIKASSLNTIPLLICYTDSSSCSGGIAINDLTKLSEIIPADQKAVNLSIGKEGGEIDLTELKTKDATFSIVQAKKSSATVSSITMDEDSPNTKISRLILESIHFGTGLFYFNANEITFKMCRTIMLPNISFNEEGGVLYIDDYSFDQLRTRIDGIYPMTNFVTVIDQRYSSLEITDSKYLFKDSFTERDFPFDQIPKVVFNIGMQSNNDYEFQYKVSTQIIDSVTLKFASHKLYQDKFNPKIKINMNNFNIIEKANKIEIDIDDGINSGNTIDLNYVPKHNYFTFKGENLVIKNAGAKKENNFCVCKSVPCTVGFCESDMNEISYSELNSKIQAVSDDVVKVTIVGEQEGSSPVLSLSSINNKNAKFIGVGTNPTIKIDLETQYESPNNKIEFSNIKIDHTEGQSLQISNLILNEDCTIDSSFKSIPFTTDYLQCFVSHLVFSTLNVKKSLELKGDATNSQSSTKVTFASSSIFSYALPSSVTIKQASLIFNNLEFNLANSLPNLSISAELTDFTINGENGNLDSLLSDLIIEQTSNLKSVYIKGTWTNNNPKKFITFNKFSSNLYLDSDNIPLNIIYLTNEKIILERSLVNIIGKLTFKGSYSGNYELSASSTINGGGKATLKINHAHISSGIANFQFATSNLDFVIGTYTSESVSPKFKFFLLIDLDGSNSLTITNPYKNSVEFTYDVHCTITEKLNDPRMVNFIGQNHSLITVNKENTIKRADHITFDSDATIGFNNNNFKLAVINGNNLIFYTNKSPLISSVDFFYGDCTSCTGTQLKTEDLSIIDQLIPMKDAEVTITFYDSLEDKNKFIDLNKQSLKIHSLTLKSSFSAVKKNVNIILGHSVDYLFLDCITLNNVDEDSISLKKATLRKGSSFSKNANLANVECINLDQDSIFDATFTEFGHELIMNIESSTYITLNYTKTGMKIIKDFNSKTTVFNIDVSKIPNVNLLINSKKTPKINLEKDVSELHQIKSLVFDSSTFVIGSNWDKLDESSSKVQYSFNTKRTDVIVITDSFPFYSWNLMYEYMIQFSDVIAPFTLNDEFTLHNENISLSTYIPTHHKYSDIVFKELKLSGSSTIQHAKETSTKKLIINELEVDEDSLANVINANVKDSLKIEEGGVLNGDFEIDPYIIEIEIEWSLNHLPLLNPSLLQTIYPTELKIIYKGSSIDGHESEFDDILINGLTIMKNVSLTSKLLSKVKFESDDEESFDDGEKLALKLIQDSETNEVKITLTRPLSDRTLPPTNDPTKISPEPTFDPSQADKPTVDDSYNLNSNKMVFLQNGYMDDSNEISIENNQNEILIVHAKANQVSLSTETSAHPKKNIYLSPTKQNTEIIIERSNSYGLGEFGIHANSQNPIVKVPTTNVPLNLFNDEESEVTFEVDDQTTFKNSMSLKKLTLNKGNLKIKLPASTSSVNFDSVETYQSSVYDSFNGNEVVESVINKMTVKYGSTISIEKARFANLISMGENTQIEIKKVANFDDETVIELTKSSFIELGSSEIKGVCRQIRLVENEKLLGQDEVNIQLICGHNFNCSAWKSKFVGDQTFTKAKCTVNKNREMCLVITDAKDDENGNGDGNSSKKKFSVFLICGIAVGVVGVVAIAATFIYRCIKNRKPAIKGYVSHSNTNNNPNIDEILVNDGNLDI